MDNAMCTICAEYLTADNCYVLPCGHTFHNTCIITWKQTSPTCPQCRVRFKDPTKIFFDINCKDDETQMDSAALKNQVTDLNFKLKEKDRSVEVMKEQSKVIVLDNNKKVKALQELNLQLQNSMNTCEALHRQLSYMEKFKKEAKRSREETTGLQKRLSSLKNVQECVDGCTSDVDDMMKNYSCSPDAMKQIATAYIILKKEYERTKESKKKVEDSKKRTDSELKSMQQQIHKLSQEGYSNKVKLKEMEVNYEKTLEDKKKLERNQKILEQAFASPSPRSSAVKRFLNESPWSSDLKRSCLQKIGDEERNTEQNGSLILVDSPPLTDDCNSTTAYDSDDHQNEEGDGLDEESKELANEFGLNYVATTSLSRPPLKDKNNIIHKQFNLPVKRSASSSSSSSSLPHLKKGYNGLGGQSKVLIIPKKSSSFAKPTTKTNTSKRIKIPRNNSTISKLFSGSSKSNICSAPRLPKFDVTLDTP